MATTKRLRKHVPFIVDEQKQLNQMMRFIEQEGHEKAEEIDCKTEEEFNILKGSFIQEARIKINKEFDKKENQVTVQARIKNALEVTQGRMKVLQFKNDVMRDLIELAREQIKKDMGCSARYGKILQLLMIEGLYKLMEPNVIVRVKQSDTELVKTSLPTIEAVYKKTTTKNVSLTLDEIYLPVTVLGGVQLRARNGKVSLMNTLDARLEQTILSCNPVITKLMFGTVFRPFD